MLDGVDSDNAMKKVGLINEEVIRHEKEKTRPIHADYGFLNNPLGFICIMEVIPAKNREKGVNF